MLILVGIAGVVIYLTLSSLKILGKYFSSYRCTVPVL
jgi:hypothetical protein